MAIIKADPDKIAAARKSDVHEKHVLQSTSYFVHYVHDAFWSDPDAVANLEIFANDAERRLQEASQDMQKLLSEVYDNDIELLTAHAARMRTAGANILLLKSGLIHALKVDGENPKFRAIATEIYGYIRAEIEATRNLMI